MWEGPGPLRILLIVLFPGSFLRHVNQARVSIIIVDRFLAWDIQELASHLVGEVENVRAAGRRVLENFLLSLGFCQVDSMFGEPLGIKIFLLAATILPGFAASPLFPDYTVNSHIPPPGLFLPPVIVSRPAHIFNCLQQTGLFLDSFPQISSFPLPLALLDVVDAMKTFWNSQWLSKREGWLQCINNRVTTGLC